MSVRPLYGGAFSVELPEVFIDVSRFRQVPNHQEVLADPDCDRSLIVEIFQMDETVSNDQAILHYFTELAQANQAKSAMLYSQGPLSIDDMPNMDHKVQGVFLHGIGKQEVSKFNEPDSAANEVLICIALLRLPHITSDILITMNGPIKFSKEGSSAHKLATSEDETITLFNHALKTFHVNSWGMFFPPVQK